MASSHSWRLLQIKAEGVPRLLIQYKFDDNKFHTKITDLSSIWSEALSMDEIFRRAGEIGCSIDPSEDAEQFEIFRNIITGALGGGEGTSIKLNDSRDSSALSLQVSAQLPAPLAPFTWLIKLQKQPQTCLAEELVLPLIAQVNDIHDRMQSLISELHDKDRVITKLTDRFEMSGNDLTTVFPGLANIRRSKKLSQREQFAHHVHGLADFDEEVWARNITNRYCSTVIDDRMINRGLEGLPQVDQSNFRESGTADWWTHIPVQVQSIPLSPAGNNRNVGGSSSPKNGNSSGSSETDSFQRKSTPPQFQHEHDDQTKREQAKNAHGTPTSVIGDDDSTDGDKGDQDTKVCDSLHAEEKKDKLITLSTHSPSTEASNTLLSAPAPTSHAKSRGKIGVLGGRAKAPSTYDGSAEVTNIAAPPSFRRTKFGVIGGKSNNQDEKVSNTNHQPASLIVKTDDIAFDGSEITSTTLGNNTSSPESVASPNPCGDHSIKQSEVSVCIESSLERASAKREDLKRALENKIKAPTKKKRKF